MNLVSKCGESFMGIRFRVPLIKPDVQISCILFTDHQLPEVACETPRFEGMISG